MQAPQFYIPIDTEISQFLLHLRTHPRTILSAKFGDGKSYFLDKFAKDSAVEEEFKIIKIYPINYQVVGDNDIFTLLKYDVLLQLLVENMVGDQTIHGVFDGQKDGAKILTALFDGFAKVDPSPKAQIPAATLKLFKSIACISEKRQIWGGGNRATRTLLQKLEKTSPLYLEDPTTKLIRQSLDDWRKHNGKKVVLVVEDLDRLDPMHLFRILNVFSAHMDYIYRNGDTPTDTLVGSRFGFDSIVFVLEYENLKRLFTHFYGDETSFDGYISKFIPRGFFTYSLRKSANSFFFENISRITGVDQAHVSILLDLIIKDLSLRDMAYAVKDVEAQVSLHSEPARNYDFLLMVAIMVRLGMGTTSIINACELLFRKDPIAFVRYIIDFTYLEGFSDQKGMLKTDATTMYYVSGRSYIDGSADIGRISPVPDNMRELEIQQFVTRLLGYVLP
jgi:KAP family P-loop domain.